MASRKVTKGVEGKRRPGRIGAIASRASSRFSKRRRRPSSKKGRASSSAKGKRRSASKRKGSGRFSRAFPSRISPVFRQYVTHVGKGSGEAFALADVDVSYRGGSETTRNLIPVSLGRLSPKAVRGLDFEDVERALERRYGNEYRLVRVYGLARLKPKKERKRFHFKDAGKAKKRQGPSRRRVKRAT